MYDKSPLRGSNRRIFERQGFIAKKRSCGKIGCKSDNINGKRVIIGCTWRGGVGGEVAFRLKVIRQAMKDFHVENGSDDGSEAQQADGNDGIDEESYATPAATAAGAPGGRTRGIAARVGLLQLDPRLGEAPWPRPPVTVQPTTRVIDVKERWRGHLASCESVKALIYYARVEARERWRLHHGFALQSAASFITIHVAER